MFSPDSRRSALSYPRAPRLAIPTHTGWWEEDRSGPQTNELRVLLHDAYDAMEE